MNFNKINIKQFLSVSIFFVSIFAFSQKDQIKDAEKAIKKENYADAKTFVKQAENLIANADDRLKAQFYYVKGKAYYANGKGSNDDVNVAIESFNKVEAIEKQSGKIKYSKDVQDIKTSMLNSFLTKANKALESKNYLLSSKNFEQAYKMSPKDTLYLYYAASTAVTAQDYDTSLKYYEELRDLGYDGSEMQYVAIDKATGEEEVFADKITRDISVKAGTHIKPTQKLSDSKSGEIIKNIALIYINKGNREKAMDAIKEARAKNPDDMTLLLNEANIQLQLGNKEEFKKLIQLATEKDPKNPELQYNLGVLAAEAGDIDAAKMHYTKALELNPSYADANTNMAVVILSQEKAMIDEMNSLGTSAADNKRYDELMQARTELYKEAIPYLEQTLKLQPQNLQAAKTLMNIYSAIGDTVKFKEMKAQVEAIENGQ